MVGKRLTNKEKAKESAQITKEAIKREVLRLIIEEMEKTRQWDWAFGTTYRRNGQVVEAGQPRDMIDTRDIAKSLKVKVTRDTVDISWSSDDAAYYFAKVGEQFAEEVIPVVLEKVGEKIAIYVVSTRINEIGL